MPMKNNPAMQHRSSGLEAVPTFVAIRHLWLMGMDIGLGDRFGWGWRDDDYVDHQLKVLRD